MATDQFSLPKSIHRNLRSLDARIRAQAGVRGLGITVAICAAVFAVCVLADWLIDLSRFVRFGLLGFFCATVVVCVIRYILVPLFQRFDTNELATLLEAGNPELKESVSSTVELSDESVPEEHRGSRWMRRQLMARTDKAAAGAIASKAVPLKSTLRALGLALLAIAALALPFGIWPSSSKLMAARFFQPWKNLDRPTNLYFDVLNGDRVIAHGSDAHIVAVPRWREQEEERPESVLVNWSFTDGDSGSKRMRWDAGAHAYLADIRHVVADFDYHITAGATRSKDYHIQAVVAPAVETLLLDVEPPSYSGLPAEHHDGIIGEVRAFERSHLRFSLTFNKPVSEANFLWFLDDAPDDTPPQTLPMELSPDGLAASFEMMASDTGRFVIQLRDPDGLTNEDEEKRDLFVTPDREPTVRFANGDQTQSARPDAVVAVAVTSSDDIGMGELSLHYFIEETEAGSIPFPELDKGARRVDHIFEMDLANLDIPEGTAFSYRVRAADERPVPEPNVAWTPDRRLIISAAADSLDQQQLTAQQEKLRDQIKEIREQVAADRKETRKLKDKLNQASREGEPFQDDKQLAGIASNEFKLSEELESVSQELQKHPLFDELAKRAQEVSREDIPKASEELGKGARETRPKAKAKNLQEAEKALNNAEWKLRNLEERFNELAELEQDIARLDQLAKETEQLADNVEQLENDRAAAKAEQDEQARQQKQQDLVDKQNELLQKQQELAENLDDLSERNPELVDAARKAQMQRLQKVAEQARELANQENRLADSFQDEANENRSASQSTMQKAREVQRQAERLEREMKQKGLQNTVDSRPLREAVQKLQQGDIEQPEQAMQDAAKQLQQKSQNLAGDSSAAQDAANTNSQQDADAQAALSKEERHELATKSKQVSQKAQEVADALREIREEREQQDQRANSRTAAEKQRGSELAKKQQELADEAEKLAAKTEAQRGKNDPATKQAQQAARQAQQAANQAQSGSQQQAAQSAQQASNSEQSSSNELGKQGDQRSRELSESAKQLAEAQKQLADQMQKSAEQQQQGQQESQSQELARKQQQLAEEADKLARIAEADRGEKDPAARQARQAAEQAKQAAEQAQAGQHKQAAQSAQQASKNEQSSGRQLSKQGDARSQKLSETAKELAADQEKLAQEMKDAAKDPSAARQARQEGQQAVAKQMQQLAKELAEASEELNSNPVDMPAQGDKAQQAQQSAQQAQQQAQQAGQQSKQSNSKQASQSAREAAKKMQDAANKAQQASKGNVKDSPVPEDVGEQFAKAIKSVKEAGEELAQKPGTQETGDQQGQNPGEGEKPGDKKGEGEGEEEGQGKGQKGKGEQGKGQQPGQTPDPNAQQGKPQPNGKQGQGQGKSMGAQQLRDAAKQLSQAAKDALPKQGEGKTGEQGVSRTGENTEAGGNPPGRDGRLEELLGLQREGRDWGKLPGHLQTEILQGAGKNPNGDYAKLIRGYFREIAKATDEDSKPATKPKADK